MLSVKEFLKEGEVSAEEILKKCKNLKDKNYFITLKEDLSFKNGKLKGLPISVKDCICTKNLLTTAGSKILHNYVPPFDATVISTVKESGGMILGKTAQDEFGFGTFSTNCAYGAPKNPWDEKRVCGGSSGGAAGLTAALNYPHIALAESTGGSISCPASFCGVVGLTPTYGLVSRYGLIDYANSLDKIGPIGRSVWDVAFMLSIISGYDPMDQTSLEVKKRDYTLDLDKDVREIRIGVPEEYFRGIDPKISELVWKAIKDLEGLGVKYKKVSLPHADPALYAYYIIATAEASTNLAKFCGIRYGLHEPLKGNFDEYFSDVRSEGFGEEAKRRIILGTYARMKGYRDKYYLQAMKIRTLVIQDFKKAFKDVDVLAAPTMPSIAPTFEKAMSMSPLEMYKMDKLTVPSNLAGIPQLSIPCGFVKEMPVGLHLLGNHLEEKKILRTGSAYEKLRGKIKYPKV